MPACQDAELIEMVKNVRSDINYAYKLRETVDGMMLVNTLLCKYLIRLGVNLDPPKHGPACSSSLEHGASTTLRLGPGLSHVLPKCATKTE